MSITWREGTEIYFNDQYFYAFYSNKNIDIYSTKFVNLAQILDVSDFDVISLKSSFIKPAIFVLTKRAVLVYSPYYSTFGTINFCRIHLESISSEFTSLEVSMTGEFLVLTMKGDCCVYRVHWAATVAEEPQKIDNLQKVSIVKFGESIIRNSLSNGKKSITEDDRFWATQGLKKKNIYIWDFESVLLAGGVVMSDSALKNFCLYNEDEIEFFDFRSKLL